jgi:hypothetical protein
MRDFFMSRYHSYLNSAVTVIDSYTKGTPLTHHLKLFFQTDKKFGSKDRKSISTLCYHYFRCSFLFNETETNENKIIVLLDYTNIDFWTSLSISTDIINFGLDVRKITFQNNQQYKFIGASGVFLIDKAGKYSFFDSRDSELNGDIFWTTGGNSCKIITFSDQIVSGDSPQRFCFFNINNDLYIKNNTGINREIVFHSLYQQGS